MALNIACRDPTQQLSNWAASASQARENDSAAARAPKLAANQIAVGVHSMSQVALPEHSGRRDCIWDSNRSHQTSPYALIGRPQRQQERLQPVGKHPPKQRDKNPQTK